MSKTHKHKLKHLVRGWGDTQIYCSKCWEVLYIIKQNRSNQT